MAENSVIYEVRDVYLPANGRTEVRVPAYVLSPLDADGSFEVSIGKTNSFQPGFIAVQIPTAEGFDRVVLRDTSGKPNTVRVAFSAERVRDQRLNVSGPVRVIDPFSQAVEQQRVFLRGAGVMPNDNRAHAELANPAGSGVLVTLVGFMLTTKTPDAEFRLFGAEDDTPLANELEAISVRIGKNGAFEYGTAQVRYDSLITQTVNNTAGDIENLGTLTVQPNAPVQRELTIQLEEGSRVHLAAIENNVDVRAQFQWIEEPVS